VDEWLVLEIHPRANDYHISILRQILPTKSAPRKKEPWSAASADAKKYWGHGQAGDLTIVFSTVLLEAATSSVGNSNTAVIQPCIRGLNTDSLYSDTVYFLRSTRLQIQYNTASRPYYHPVLKWVGLLTLLSPPSCRSLLSSRT
jgi:hypothetical protein